MYTLSVEKRLAVISSLVEGNSIRSTERMTGVHRDTICRLLVETGQNCSVLLVACRRVTITEFCASKLVWPAAVNSCSPKISSYN